MLSAGPGGPDRGPAKIVVGQLEGGFVKPGPGHLEDVQVGRHGLFAELLELLGGKQGIAPGQPRGRGRTTAKLRAQRGVQVALLVLAPASARTGIVAPDLGADSVTAKASEVALKLPFL